VRAEKLWGFRRVWGCGKDQRLRSAWKDKVEQEIEAEVRG
jgi:hypothetical protein